MRVLHFSDVHIGVENYGRPATEADVAALPPHFAPGAERSGFVGMPTRLLDFLTALDEMVDYALREGVDLVLFSGDAYKSRDPSQTHQREFVGRIARLAEAGIVVFLTPGNHDLPHVANRASALDIFPTLRVENVVTGTTLATYRVATRAGDAQVVALPWIRIGGFMAKEETRGLSLEEIKVAIEARITEHLADEVAQLDPALPAFLCAHVNIAGATTASERSMMLGNDHVLGLGTVAIPAFDYVALGNIHKHQVLTQNPTVAYAGSLERIDFSEEREDKGFCVIDVDPSKPRGERMSSFSFVPVAARAMLTIDVAVRSGEDPTDAVLAAIGKHAGSGSGQAIEGAIVRVRVSMDAEQEPAFRETAVRQALAAAHYVTGIERSVRREARTRLGTDEAERLGPIEALRRYLGSKNTPAERERVLIERAEALIREEVEGAE
ncbi:MAG: exonuclease subunit SbcD [Chloroflexi bacterium]|nr:exonuclease subunit SbcD [Chloroflexota bacterium]